MRILHISSVPVDYPGGTEKVIWELSKKQSVKNRTTILQTDLYESKPNFNKNQIKEGIEIITCKNNFFLGGFGYSKEFKGTLKKIWADFDIIHIHGHGRFTSNFSLKFLRGKKPLIYTPHGFFHNEKNSFFKKSHNLFFKNRLKYATFLTASTEMDYGSFNKLGISEDRIRVVPGGIEMSKFKKPSQRNILAFKKKYDLSKKTLLYVGRVHESKGLQYVVEAIKNIDCKLLIIGRDGGYVESLKKKIDILNIGDRVKFLGEVSDPVLITAYFSSEALILFSEWEGFGLVVVEAMASNLPVVVSNRGSLPFLVKNRQNGLVVKYKNVNELERSIVQILNNKKVRKELITAGKKTAQRFDWSTVNDNLEKIYHEAIKKFKE